MADLRSVDSPRRIICLSKKRESLACDHKSFGFGLSGKHGPKLAEVYGFVGSITTIMTTVILLAWAYIPDTYLHSVGIFYYPNRYWALAVPTYLMVTIALVVAFYIGLNFMATPPPTSTNVMFDEYSRELHGFTPAVLLEDRPIEPISDIGVHQINDLMFRREGK